MKRLTTAALVAVSMCALAGTAPAQSTTVSGIAKAQQHSKLAPADEYFGPLKMSFLGIRNTIHDLTLRYDSEPNNHNALFGMAVQTELSLKDWERKYPRDGAVVRQVYYLRALYAKFVEMPEAGKKKADTEQWLFTRYASTSYARDVKKELAQATPAPGAPPAAGPALVPGSSTQPAAVTGIPAASTSSANAPAANAPAATATTSAH